jgi:DNA mismatch repair protein MutL
MGKVRLLDRHVSEKIAAGEVVERPASVVKELVENSLDAGAGRIAVAVSGGGQDLISVRDDGCGMSREDALTALQRFATSKIRAWEDMERLGTLGFRGEALPSIAAVSRMEIYTRAAEEEAGVHLVIEGGDVTSVADMGLPRGTTIEVRDMFFNTPARRKFLKSAPYEASLIIESVGRMSLAFPHVHMSIENQGKQVLNHPPQLPVLRRLVNMWKLEHESDLLEVSHVSQSLRLQGFVSRHDVRRPTRRDQVFFINGRLVKSPLVSQALQEAYASIGHIQGFPLALIFFEMDGSVVDVNVHPTKSEVRFASSGDIFKSVRLAVSAALTGSAFPGPPPPRYSPALCTARDERASYNAPSQGTLFETSRDGSSDLIPEAFPEVPLQGFTTVATSPEDPTSSVIPLAQLYRTWLVVIVDGVLWLVDQHAAHERVNYERLKEERGGQALQELLFPLLLEFTPPEAAVLRENLDALEEVGLRLEPFGGESYIVRAVPCTTKRFHAQEAVRDLLADLLQSWRDTPADSRREKILQLTACHSSIKAGEEISREEMVRLVEDLRRTSNPFFCPHGRPAALRMTREELERLFRRKSPS